MAYLWNGELRVVNGQMMVNDGYPVVDSEGIIIDKRFTSTVELQFIFSNDG